MNIIIVEIAKILVKISKNSLFKILILEINDMGFCFFDVLKDFLFLIYKINILD